MNPQVKIKNNKMVVECLLCSEDIDVGFKPKINKFITCKSCEMVFEIINLDPIMIDWPYYDDGDYDEEDDFGDGD